MKATTFLSALAFIMSSMMMPAQNNPLESMTCNELLNQGLCERAAQCIDNPRISTERNQIGRAIALLGAGKFAEASSLFWKNEHSLTLEFRLLWKGIFLLATGHYKNAIVALKKLEKIENRQDTQVQMHWVPYLLWLCYNRLGDNVAGFKYYFRIASSYPNMAPQNIEYGTIAVFANAGQFFRTIYEPLMARIMYSLVLNADPRHPQANIEVGTMLVEGGDYNEAIRFLKPIGESKTDRFKILALLALAHKSLGEVKTAIRYYKRALEEVPNDPNTLNNMAFAYRTLGKLAAAEKIYLKVLRIDQNHMPSIYGLGITYCLMAKFDTARQLADRLHGLKDSSADIYYEALISMLPNSATFTNLSRPIARGDNIVCIILRDNTRNLYYLKSPNNSTPAI